MLLFSKQVSRSLLFVVLVSLTQSISADTYEEGKQAFLRKDYEQALKILKPLAERGNSKAQITVGLMYNYGQGVKKDTAESIKWYRKAAEQGEKLIQHYLGVKYFQGRGVEQNYQEAEKWWKMSAAAGIVDAQFNLALMYYRGTGVPQDYEKAAKLFEKAANQGHANAQYSLAAMYIFGQSKPTNYKEALKWFTKSANQGVAQAQFNLGAFYENGYGVNRDLRKALEWYTKAADQDLQEAIEKVSVLQQMVSPPAAKPQNSPLSKNRPTKEKAAVNSMLSEVSTPNKTPSTLNVSNWIKQKPANSYTIQLASVSNENDIIQYITNSGLDSNAGYIVVTVNNSTHYTAIYGIYSTYSDAQQSINKLPKVIRKTKPWVRNVGILQGLLQ